jgi:hypothetical protein
MLIMTELMTDEFFFPQLIITSLGALGCGIALRDEVTNTPSSGQGC